MSHVRTSSNTFIYLRAAGSVTNTDFRLVLEARDFNLTKGETEELDNTTMETRDFVTTIPSALQGQGEFTVNCILNLNTSASAVNGNSPLNGSQLSIFNASGGTAEFEVVMRLSNGTSVAVPIHPEDASVTSRTRIQFNARVTAAAIGGSAKGLYEFPVAFKILGAVAVSATV